MPHLTGDDAATAIVVRAEEGRVRIALEELPAADLGIGEVTIRVRYSSINFKDALTLEPERRVAREYPLIPGVDLSGEVIASDVAEVSVGSHVVVQGRGLGTAHHGGFATLARVPADWIVPIPAPLDARSTMILGTPALTAGLAVERIVREGVEPRGPVVVTGATGGVGSCAVALLADHGYEVSATSRSTEAEPYLRRLGAHAVLSPAALRDAGTSPLGHARWAAAVDNVGGETLAALLRTTRMGGVIAVVGHVGGPDLRTTVYPWIVRGVVVAGIDTEHLATDRRANVWTSLAAAYARGVFEHVAAEEITLDQVPEALRRVRAGQTRGRIVVRML